MGTSGTGGHQRHEHRHRLPARAVRRAGADRLRGAGAGGPAPPPRAGSAAAQSDPLGNLWAEVPTEGAPHVVVTGHNDQIGLIVTYVDEHGFVFFDKVGGVDPQLLPGRHLADPQREGTRRRRRRAQADPHHPQGRAGQGAGAPRTVHGHRRVRRGTRLSPACGIGDAVTFEASFLEAGGRRRRLARVRQPGGRLRGLPRPRALRGRAGFRPSSPRWPPCTKRRPSWGAKGHGSSSRRRRDHRRRRRLRQRGPLRRPQEARRRGQAGAAARSSTAAPAATWRSSTTRSMRPRPRASPSRSRRCRGGRRPTPRSSCRRGARPPCRSASPCATCTRRSR